MYKTLATVTAPSALALGLVIALAACGHTPPPAQPLAWRVDLAQSSVNFVSTKAGAPGAGGVSEVSRFGRFSGGMSAQGRVEFDVELASVDTGVGIRDERLRTVLFNVAAVPRATFSAQIDPALIAALPPQGARDVELAGQLTLAGQTKPVAARVRVARGAGGDLQVGTREPIVVDAQQFGLKPGVEALRELMGLNFLASAAPVTFALVLHEQR